MRSGLVVPGLCAATALLATMSLLVLVPLPAHGQDANDATPFFGTWTLSLETGDEAGEATIRLRPGAGGMQGVWLTEDGDEPLNHLEWGGNAVTFEVRSYEDGSGFTSALKATLDGDSLAGTITTPAGSFPVSGVREVQKPEPKVVELVPPAVTQLDANEAEEYLGEWILDAELAGNRLSFGLILEERESKVAALLVGQNGDQPIDDAKIDDEGQLVLSFEASFGALQIAMKREADYLVGTFGAPSAGFSGDLSGERGTVNRRGGGGSLLSGGRPRAEAEIAGGLVQIFFVKEPASRDSFAQFIDGPSPQVLEFYEDPAIKLLTDQDLDFGNGQIAPAENHAPGYPGAYSLWLRREGNDYGLVWNSLPDVWGSMYHEEKNVLVVPLVHSQAESPVRALEFEVNSEDGQSGRIEIRWGAHVWSASFEVVG